MVKWCSAGTCRNHHSMTDSDGKSKFSFFKFPVTKDSQDGGPSGRELALALMPSLTSRGNPRTPCNMCTSARHTSFLGSLPRSSAIQITSRPNLLRLGNYQQLTSARKLRRFSNAMSRHGKKMLGKANGPSKKKCRVAYAVPVGVQDTSLASSESPQHQPTPDSPQPSTSSVSPSSVPQQMLFDEISALRDYNDPQYEITYEQN
ncbi:hypothetical protein KUCAC02_026175 [Chaenocephalus aceratus]|uniref:Uncharacterized protein n=1 Tax=Chaenocephalus aceratus TaxID=36190 RepID=A0ACB9VX22_CHAAC|nr:hypothetical protein KUCAC02_026175 [Chaenocephalus aceratus]